MSSRPQLLSKRCSSSTHQVHELECWPPHWEDVDSERKRVEIRRNDRGYQVGDVLVLREWNPEMLISEIGLDGPYTGRVCHRTVTHVLHGGEFGLAGGYVALSLASTVSTFAVRRRDGKCVSVMIDAEDVERVLALGRWNLDPRGYVVRCRRGKPHLKLSRFVMDAKPGDPEVDHINGDKLDNRKMNLRAASHKLNMQNLAMVNDRGGSKYRGVSWHRKGRKWRAAQIVDGQYFHLGLYVTEEEAAAALSAFRRENGLDER